MDHEKTRERIPGFFILNEEGRPAILSGHPGVRKFISVDEIVDPLS